MAIRLSSGQPNGLGAYPVDIEVDITPGIFRFAIVGLPDKGIDESRDRIASAIKNSGLSAPQRSNHRITINLAPADLKKTGPMFDLPIALGYLAAAKQIRAHFEKKFFAGELALDGSLRTIRGILPIALLAKKVGITEFFVPKGNGAEAAVLDGLIVYEAHTLGEVIDHLEERRFLAPHPQIPFTAAAGKEPHDFSDIRGQEIAKRAAEIAAAGRHHLGLSGPPGSGKTLIARALPALLPPLTFEEALEVTAIYSVSGMETEVLNANGLINVRPFRSPHHTSSHAALVGGGTIPMPGEITLAHRGILFLDEFPEFEQRVIESLREPLEDRVVSVARVKQRTIFPAEVLLVAAMNICPCGNRGTTKICTCGPQHLSRYQRRMSGPIVDRIDLWVEVAPVEYEKLHSVPESDSSESIRARVVAAHERQASRYAETSYRNNSDVGVKDIDRYCGLSAPLRTVLSHASKKLGLSARSYHRIMKIARTIADLDGEDIVGEKHLFEALQFRPRLVTSL